MTDPKAAGLLMKFFRPATASSKNSFSLRRLSNLRHAFGHAKRAMAKTDPVRFDRARTRLKRVSGFREELGQVLMFSPDLLFDCVSR